MKSQIRKQLKFEEDRRQQENIKSKRVRSRSKIVENGEASVTRDKRGSSPFLKIEVKELASFYGSEIGNRIRRAR